MNILRKTGLLLLLLAMTALSCTKVVTEQVIVKETETIRDTLGVIAAVLGDKLREGRDHRRLDFNL